MALTSLADINNLNLLFHAAQNGNSKITQILIEINFDVNLKENDRLAVDLAYENFHFETILVLLKLNSLFPNNFDKNCDDEIKNFIEMSLKFHELIKSDDSAELTQMMTENSNLRYFYNLNNQSALSFALENKKFEIYELLMTHNLYFSVYEDMDEVMENLTKEEQEKVHEINFRNKKNVQQEQHLHTFLRIL